MLQGSGRLLLHSLILILFYAGGARADQDPPPTPEQLEFFERHVRPVFVEHCHKCHGGTQQKGGLSLTSRATLLRGGDSGPALASDKPDASELLKAVNYDPDGYQMPPSGKLPAETIAKLTEWVRMGAPWPADPQQAGASHTSFVDVFPKRASYWSFQPLKRVAPPIVQAVEWSRTPIDRFVLSRLEEAELRPALETDRRTWLRRATYYATGLPPSREEIAAFLGDEAPGAYERVVDRLLSSPRLGERWGRHWLDLARYAESRGHEFDYDVANPWPYRDYVIRAMNEDVPYDRFVVEQVAGDLLPSPGISGTADAQSMTARIDEATGSNESLVATGFWLMGEWVHSPVDIRKEEAERFDNMIDVYGKTFLGLTIACARCHDHKFDPISQQDYFAISGYLQSCSYAQRPYDTLDHNLRIKTQLEALDRRALPPILAAIGSAASPVLNRLDEYLLAARACVSRAGPEPAAEISESVLETAAKEKNLEVQTLAAWCRHLQKAQSDRNDPFYLWANVSEEGGQNVERAQGLLERPSPMEVSVDESRRGTMVSILAADGVAFSLPPKQEGTGPRTWLGDDPLSPLKHAATKDETCLDPDFANAQSGSGVMNEPGAIGKTPRAGRTLRTETFAIASDRISCRVRGACSTYLAVDSHITINGPLHGGLYRQHEANAAWRWIELDVSRYRGHRAHLEFLVPSGAEFSVREIHLGSPPSRQDAVDSESVAGVMAQAVQQAAASSPAALSGVLRKVWSAVDNPALAQWMLQHPDLFGLTDAAIRSGIAKVAEPLLNERRNLVQKIQHVSKSAPSLLEGSAEDEPLHIRGNPAKPGEVVPRRYLSVFEGTGPGAEMPGSGRLEWANQMVDPRQTPLLARVIANRLWHHAFGRGLVPTVDDFGHMGQLPSHPELLDWLALELIDHDWSLKHLHRMILLSSVYRMDSRDDDAQADRIAEIDPQNILLHRMNVKRIDGESIRDAVLLLSGRLDERLYGASVPIHLTSFLEGRGRPGESGPIDGRGRRSLYLSVRRNFQEPFLVAFDFPTPHTSIGRRSVSNVPAQALALMNNPLIQEQTQLWARQVLARPSPTPLSSRIEALYESAFGRLPTPDESSAAESFLTGTAQERKTSPDSPSVWAELCHALVNVKEFVFLR